MLTKGEAFSEAQKHVNESMQLGFHIGNLGTLDSNEEDIKSSLGEFSKICEEFRSGFKKRLHPMKTWTNLSLTRTSNMRKY